MSTESKAPRRPARPRPADTCWLTVHIRGVAYSARPIRPETSEVIRAWRLRKSDGETYVVADTIHGATCDCGDQVFRHEGEDQVGCKHIRAMRALGLVEPDGDGGAESWPAWTDTHAFTSR